jgi:hypothetical protein
VEIIQVDKFIKFGWIIAAFSGLFTTVLSILAIFSETGTDPIGITNPWHLLDGIIYLILAYGIYRKSRFSAITIFILHCYFQFYMRTTAGTIAVIFAVIYLQAIVGTFIFHYRENKATNNSSEA